MKFRFFFPLVDEMIQRQEANLEVLIGSLTADLEGLADILRQEEADRGARQRRLQELTPEIRSLEARLAAAAQGG
jgi:chromosome segregation ATPase